MGREVRMIKKGWEHPKNEYDKFIPLYPYDFYERRKNEWIKLLEEGGLQFAIEEDGMPPDIREYMPDWPQEEKTMLVMYEDTSEGTPISPAFETAEELAKWLADNKASVFANLTLSYDEWLEAINHDFITAKIAPGIIAV